MQVNTDSGSGSHAYQVERTPAPLFLFIIVGSVVCETVFLFVFCLTSLLWTRPLARPLAAP